MEDVKRNKSKQVESGESTSLKMMKRERTD